MDVILAVIFVLVNGVNVIGSLHLYRLSATGQMTTVLSCYKVQ